MGFTPRYEHGILESTNGDMYIFGGAQQDHNLNSTQLLRKGEAYFFIHFTIRKIGF